MEKKTQVMTGRISLKVFPEILEAVDIEASRIRKEGLRFGQRKAKSAIVIMAAIEEFLAMPEETRNEIYIKRVARYESLLSQPCNRIFNSKSEG